MDLRNPYQSTPGTLEGQNPSPGIVRLLFSFEGRVTRGQYWLVHMGLLGLLIGVFVLLGVIGSFGKEKTAVGEYALYSLIPLVVLYIWTNLAVSVKRCHDRGKSGAFILIQLIPYIGGFWFFIDAGCLDGTVGPNRYGPDPKGRVPDTVPVTT